MKSVSGSILAGGKSTRMGVDKANLVLGTNTLLEIQIEKMRSLRIQDIMVSGSKGSFSNVRYIEDIIKGMGPLGGLHACFAAATCPNCFVLSVDTPLIPKETLDSLLQMHLGASCEATLLVHDGRVEPLIGVYRTDIRDKITDLICGSDRSMRALLKQINYQTMPYRGDIALLMNCNTPKDYEELTHLWETQ